MAYIIRRLGLLILTLVFISIITFLVFQILPGDPVQTMLGPDADPIRIKTLRHQLGLDQPLYIQYGHLIEGFIRGDLGQSIRFSMPVRDLIFDRLPLTLSLAFMSLIIVIFVSIPLGVIAARRENSWGDLLLSIFTQFGMAIPSFFMGMILILLFGSVFSLFSPGSYVPWSEDFWGALGSLLLPALTIAIPQIAVSYRYVRNGVIEQGQMDYVRTARGKGASEWKTLSHHILRNSLIPVLTILGLILAEVVAGTIVVEQVFSLPGIGQLLITSVSYRDFPVVQGLVLYIAFVIVVINFLVDILYSVLDPRIRLK
ncbi:peptide/nickel transport system permease protein [Pullulanibacillus pueri]|uniref:ABC transporter permease n=1 Tax=Pullulanibacillus pueri TaxID=1437324 RepID=A0A8J2ZYA6_9BACL|nr:ABC transporter permease [Pullulanibacillus pueri]MBM7682868.1 peptide/nickel transport system permease protein [Pullulanibacillus pueri]GGH84335.1 ABC transporter permease [Pullulanibacillus pueri]